MQTSQMVVSHEPADLPIRERSPYYRWMRGEGIPTHFDVAGISDVTAIPRAPWARTGKGLGVFLELTGPYQAQSGMFVCEIPPGESLDVQHHLYGQFTLILQGTGATEIWQKNGPKRTFEWSKGSIFSPPKNTYYRMYNVGREPVLYFCVTTAPKVMNGLYAGWVSELGGDPAGKLSPFEFIFNCDHDFTELYDGSETYFQRTEKRVISGDRYQASVWYTNFIPNVFNELVDNLEVKVAGGQVTGYRMAGGYPIGHISQWPKGRYHKAHYHGPGALLFGLTGSGYVNLWPRQLGIHPWQDGHGDQVQLIEWAANSIYSPLDGWYHQHMSTGTFPARHVAVYGTGGGPLSTHAPGEVGDESYGVYIPVREGGSLIDYEDEDPEIRRYFIEANRKNGVECDMPPVTYRTDPIPR